MEDVTTARGHVAARFAPVREAFAGVLAAQASQGGTGAAVAVWHDGEWVVDLWGGHADRSQTTPWEADSLVMPYSVTKPFAAVCGLHLADRGLVDLDAPLTTYWPEMRARTTLRQVLAHQSGHAVLEQPAPQEAFYDWDLLCGLLAEQEPNWEPGTAHGESALFYGHLVGEIVRRVDGRSLGRYLAEEICGPLDLDFQVGLGDSDLHRVVELSGFDAEFRRNAEAGVEMHRALSNPPGALDPDVVNGRAWRAAEIPAVNGHGTARGVAGLYVALQEGRLLSRESLDALRSPAATGPDRVLDHEQTWGLGVALDSDGYGMGGVGGSFGWWSTEGDYALAFVTGHIGDHDRGDLVDGAVRTCLGLPPL